MATQTRAYIVNIGAKLQPRRVEGAVQLPNGAQLRAARGLLNLSVAELAERTGLAINTIRRAESTNETPAITDANLRLLTATLEIAGVLFIDANELGSGVRFRSPSPLPHRPRRRSQR